jgi:hypothetical protein
MRYVTGRQVQNGEGVDHSSWWLAVYLLRVESAQLKSQDFTLLKIQADDICPGQYVEPVCLMLRSAHYESVAWALDQLEIPKEEFLKAVGA